MALTLKARTMGPGLVSSPPGIPIRRWSVGVRHIIGPPHEARSIVTVGRAIVARAIIGIGREPSRKRTGNKTEADTGASPMAVPAAARGMGFRRRSGRHKQGRDHRQD